MKGVRRQVEQAANKSETNLSSTRRVPEVDDMANSGCMRKDGRKRRRLQDERVISHASFVASTNPPKNEMVERVRKRNLDEIGRSACDQVQAAGKEKCKRPGSDGSSEGNELKKAKLTPPSQARKNLRQ